MKLSAIIILASLSLVGCYVYISEIYVNDKGEMRECRAVPRGDYRNSKTIAKETVDDCAKYLKSLGYINIDSAGAIGVYYTMTETDSARIIQVIVNSPASKAGLLRGDIIIKVNGIETTNVTDARTLLFIKAYTPVVLTILRNCKIKTFTLTTVPYKGLHKIKLTANDKNQG